MRPSVSRGVSLNPASPVSIDAGAVAHLRYIRETIEAAHTFTSVPGKGCIAMGITALAAAALQSAPPLAAHWFWIWLAAAAVAIALVTFFLVRKTRQQGLSLLRGVARRFFLALLPPLGAGAVLTAALFVAGAQDLIPGVWLLLYGAGVAASGVFSVPAVSVTGFAFMALGVLALALPQGWSTLLMAAGFGGLHLVLGCLILRRHGG
jgi:hypothetical protein